MIIGALAILQGILVLVLRAWVNCEGGLPDGGTNPRNVRVARLAAGAPAAGSVGAKAVEAV